VDKEEDDKALMRVNHVAGAEEGTCGSGMWRRALMEWQRCGCFNAA